MAANAKKGKSSIDPLRLTISEKRPAFGIIGARGAIRQISGRKGTLHENIF